MTEKIKVGDVLFWCNDIIDVVIDKCTADKKKFFIVCTISYDHVRIEEIEEEILYQDIEFAEPTVM